jgi:hypothetical protein
LSTNVNLEAAKVLEIYALRWAVEVYFEEAKQHLGFLKEQYDSFKNLPKTCGIIYIPQVVA